MWEISHSVGCDVLNHQDLVPRFSIRMMEFKCEEDYNLCSSPRNQFSSVSSSSDGLRYDILICNHHISNQISS